MQRWGTWFSESSRTVLGQLSVDFRNVRFRALGLLRILLKYFWGRPGDAKIHPWRSLNRAKIVLRGSQERQRASQENSKSVPRASRSIPGKFQHHPRSIQEHPEKCPRAAAAVTAALAPGPRRGRTRTRSTYGIEAYGMKVFWNGFACTQILGSRGAKSKKEGSGIDP